MVLFVPLLTGFIVADTISWHGVRLVASAVCLFLMRVPAEVVARHWRRTPSHSSSNSANRGAAAILVLLSGIIVLPVVVDDRWLLLPLGILSLVFLAVRFLFEVEDGPQGLRGNVAAVASLSIGAPAAVLAETGDVGTTGLILWFLNSLFFAASFTYVHMKLRIVAMDANQLSIGSRLTAGRLNLLYHAVAIGSVAGLAVVGATPFATIVAFVPMTIHAVVGTLRATSTVRFSRLGLLLTAHAVIFALILGFAMGRT